MAGLLYLTSLWYTVQASKRKHDKLQDVMSHTDVIGMQLKKKIFFLVIRTGNISLFTYALN